MADYAQDGDVQHLEREFVVRKNAASIPESGVFDAPVSCIEINMHWAAYIIAVMDTLDQSDVWIGTPEQIDAARMAIREIMIALSTPCEETNLNDVVKVEWFASDTAPEGYLECDGAVYLKADYPTLVTRLAANYMVDATHFRVPDLRWRNAVGRSTEIGDELEVGEQFGDRLMQLDYTNIPAHGHQRDARGVTEFVLTTIQSNTPILGAEPNKGGWNTFPMSNPAAYQAVRSQLTGNTGEDEPFSLYTPQEALLPCIRIDNTIVGGNGAVSGFRLRQKPENSCMLQQQINGMWVDAFDYSLCRPDVVDVNGGSVEGSIAIGTYVEEYTEGGVGGVAPGMVYGSDNGDKDKALCFGTKLYIQQLVDMGLKAGIEPSDNDWIGFGLAVTSGAMGAVALFLTVPAVVPIIAMGMAMGSIGINLADLFADAKESDALNDEEAIKDVVCCMYSGLEGQTPTQVRFKASLNGCDFEPGSNQEKIRALVHAANQKLTTYLTFIRLASDMYQGAEIDSTELPCECEAEIEIIGQDGCVSTYLGGNRWRVRSRFNSAATPDRTFIKFRANVDCWRMSNLVVSGAAPSVGTRRYADCANNSHTGNPPNNACINRVDYGIVGYSEGWSMEFDATDPDCT